MIEDELRLRHLADVQTTIVRLSQHCFVIRGWSVTLVSVMFAILGGRERSSWTTVLVALAPTLIFWVLDAYYLRQERLFRRLYAAAARRLAEGGTAPHVVPFDMNATTYAVGVPSLGATLFAGHVCAIPIMLVLLIGGFAVLA